MNGRRQTGHRDSLSPLGPDPLQGVVDILWAHSAQTRCPHGMNAVSGAWVRQTGHSSASLEGSGAGSAWGAGSHRGAGSARASGVGGGRGGGDGRARACGILARRRVNLFNVLGH